MEESKGYLNKYEALLWLITKYYLIDSADFAPNEYSFMLRKNPFPDLNLSLGPYKLAKNIEDAHIYRLGHPIAQRILSIAKEKELSPEYLIFDYSNSGSKISILEPLVGKQGYMAAYMLTIVTSAQKEDYIIFSGITDDMECLNEDQCKRLFSLSGEVSECGDMIFPDDAIKTEYQKKGK